MRFEKLTTKSQDALAQAESDATRAGHPEVRAGALETAVETRLARLPKVTGRLPTLAHSCSTMARRARRSITRCSKSGVASR